jgi:sec-independent protein translocase protein TatA
MALIESTPMLVILLAILLLFGATAIPRLARSLGRAKGEFTKAKSEFDREAAAAAKDMAPAPAPGDASAPSAGPSEAQVRQAARGLGIQEAGMTLDEVKREMNRRLS